MTAPTTTARLAGKVAVVTGGADGIGRATCLRLADAGAAVVVLDRDGAKAADVVAAIEDAGGRAMAAVADVTVEDQVRAAVSDAARQYGRIDVLVNNAAIPGAQKPTHEVTEDEFDELFDVDVKGVFFCTKHVIPHMLAAGGGSVIHISSINGLVGNKDVPLYHAAKGAVRLMAKTDAVVYAENKIRFNSIHPGSIRTALSEKLAAIHPGGPDAYFQWLADMHPLGHQGEPDDIAYGVVYLASDEAKFVTGTELVIDGGYTAQ
ncbi:2,5-dichloro-2,5-cyclohexadiene-1,4-diol dehydrogenase [Mycolicibacterium murale]|uniref:2,5-dichloro-2,5-cyclohexadiene-1,4-diol dehydrogenase n=1 Tax=Mycolicibacterium murale TaxID=182220 RepID=A0A7I9WR17_9MYCO|nr:SDR family oxidoreductase [Mycolicibacterium murale]MCV7185965.1 SDR family oxidoreductase [Mycolicibacterium murale]GFG60191.1 2,5-dichloro-2,5-cyclohexadiene-1,4-diol dehydrogenase [Mycolicibacterium murale]